MISSRPDPPPEPPARPGGGDPGGGDPGGQDQAAVSGRYAAIVLAGGAATRLGGIDKAGIVVGGHSLLERTLAAVAGAQRTVVVGPRRPITAPGPVSWRREDPPGGGPVAALAAGLAAVRAEFVVVLAVDQPFIAPAVPLLLTAVAGAHSADVAALAGSDGRVNYLAAAWRRDALAAAIDASRPLAGVAVRTLFASVTVERVLDTGDWGADCDTPEDLATSRGRPQGSTPRAIAAPDRSLH